MSSCHHCLEKQQLNSFGSGSTKELHTATQELNCFCLSLTPVNSSFKYPLSITVDGVEANYIIERLLHFSIITEVIIEMHAL